ncbi:hypothetical protein GPJ56_009172 [Histomonas meleagridis]|uniref:uncharacterized protein n=1 Tax=Histomonas meleagridis TaxID=135588 RepID=UPI00355A331B|nr:hypothetical protein GPJ56_009172 [Histomonas meleagridis]KAH0799074.1 hypothetical protein GO595_007871 [Histomonas meleagridis]
MYLLTKVIWLTILDKHISSKTAQYIPTSKGYVTALHSKILVNGPNQKMKNGAKNLDYGPSVNDFSDVDPQVDPRHSYQFEDPISQVINSMNIPFLSYAAGYSSTPPDSVHGKNVEMWTLNQIYQLRSDLITLSILMDKENDSIREQIRLGFESISTSLEESESQESFRIDPISYHTRQSPDPRYTSISRPATPLTRSTSSIMKNHSELTKYKPNSTRRSTNQQNKSMSRDTIWCNVDMFLHPIDKLGPIEHYLEESKSISDKQWLTEPLGQHYSYTITRHPGYTSDPSKEKLIVPSPPSSTSCKSEVSTYLHSRLISAVVPLLRSTDNDADEEEEENSEIVHLEEQTPNTSSLIKEIQYAETKITQPAETDFCSYGQLSVNEKLVMELKYVGIELGDGFEPSDDSPLLKEMANLFSQEEAILKETNKWKKLVKDYLVKKKDIIEERNRKNKEWNAHINHLHQEEKAKNQIEHKKLRSARAFSSDSD